MTIYDDYTCTTHQQQQQQRQHMKKRNKMKTGIVRPQKNENKREKRMKMENATFCINHHWSFCLIKCRNVLLWHTHTHTNTRWDKHRWNEWNRRGICLTSRHKFSVSGIISTVLVSNTFSIVCSFFIFLLLVLSSAFGLNTVSAVVVVVFAAVAAPSLSVV